MKRACEDLPEGVPWLLLGPASGCASPWGLSCIADLDREHPRTRPQLERHPVEYDLFEEPERRARLGQATVEYRQASSILTKATGFMGAYDYTLNPYTGCSFGCSYCYAAFFARDSELRDHWGYWVQVKDNALALLKRSRRKPLRGSKIYMSSVTDPYQPIERELGLTRAILKELVQYHQPSLIIQTRSPLVTRDLDLLAEFGTVQVNMTITTDDEAVRKAFEPHCPSNRARLQAIREVRAAGIDACITMTPLLPVADAHGFAEMLLATGVEKFVVQPFHVTRGKFVAGTRNRALQIVNELEWSDTKYADAVAVLNERLPNLLEGKEGFAPL